MFKGKKKPIALTVIVSVLLVLGIALNVAVYGFLQGVMTMMFGKSNTAEMTQAEKDKVTADAKTIARNIAEEGVVLLDNNGTLPYTDSTKSVDLLGYNAKNPFYGGSGSGALSDKSTPISFAKAFADAGWTVNNELLNSYGNGLSTSYGIQDPDPESYWNKTNVNASLAVVVLGRSGGEGSDLPTEGYGADNKGHYLQLSEYEKSLISKAANQYKNVVVLLNTANMIELGPVKQLYSAEKGSTGNVDAVLWIGKPGYHGLPAVVDVLEGKVNPSGKMTDTYVYDAYSAPATKSYGDSEYTNISVSGAEQNEPAHYQEYNEGIYVGYRYYETADGLGHINYNETVIYPFGYGKSYTDFTWEISESNIPETLKGDSKISITVKVTNGGNVAGKDVVELYSVLTADGLKSAKLDHSAASLIAFEKTPLIPAGGSETVTLSFDAEDLASFDDKGAYATNGAYVIEALNYTLALRTDAHTDKEDIENPVITVAKPIVYAKNSTAPDADTLITKRPSDLKEVGNTFGANTESIVNGSKYGMNVSYLSVGSNADGWVNGIIGKGDKTAPQSLVDFISNGANVSITNKGYEVHTGTVAVASGTTLDVNNFTKTDYDDASWDTLVKQMSVAEMRRLIKDGGYTTAAVSSVNKAKSVDLDGPCGLNYFPAPNKYPGIAYPSPIMLASTWNVKLAEDFGASIAKEGMMQGASGWYAPGANIHRTPFSGRNFEYYSEDPVLSGFMSMYTCSAATKGGMVVYLKHFALNDTEINRNRNVLHWCTEQALREIYLKPFEYPVKAEAKFGLTPTTGMMSAFNYIGDRWCGASYELLTTVLRNEWGFKGTVVTDYFGGYGYMSADCAIRAGNDLMLSTIVAELSTSSNDDKFYMQQACKNILYSYSRSGLADAGFESGGMETWEIVGIVINVVWWAATVALGALCALAWIKYIKVSKTEQATETVADNGETDIT